jgi:hypothetical protein
VASSQDMFQRQAQEVRSIFGDLKIVEAIADFVVYVTADEQEHSVPGDPNKCMFANACKRAFGSKGVLFYPSVDLLDPRDPSQRIVMRFHLPTETRQRLEAFDRGEGGLREATFILKAVPKSRRLAESAKARRKYDRARRLRVENGLPEVSAEKQAAARKAHVTRRTSRLMGVRTGTGQVHTRNA